MPRLPLLAAAWFAGLFLAATFPLVWPLPAVIAVAALLLVAAVAVARRPLPPAAGIAALALAAATLGALRVSLADWRPALAAWEPAYGREVTVVGVVDGDAVPQGRFTTVRVAVEDLAVEGVPWLVGGAWQPREGALMPDAGRVVCRVLASLCAPAPSVQVRLPATQALRYGDRLRLAGRLAGIPILESFSYRETLARGGVYGGLTFPKVESLAAGQAPPLRLAVVSLRAWAEGTIDTLYPRHPVEAGLLKGALLGLSDRLPADAAEALRRASLSHLIVVSGFNITIVVLGLVGLLTGLRFGFAALAATLASRRHWRLAHLAQQPLRVCFTTSPYVPLLTTVAVAGYVALVGGGSSAVRAAVMGLVVVLALFLGRPTTGYVTLAAAAWLITLVTPWAAFDIGFQLSFAGTLGLVVVTPLLALPLSRWLAWRGPTQGLVEAIGVTLGATLMTAPLLSYYFGQVSVVGLAANLLVMPAQPFLMYLGGAALALAPVWPWLAQQVAALAWLPLAWTVQVARWLGEAPWAAVDARLGVMPLVLYYATLAAAGYWLWARRGSATHADGTPVTAPIAGRAPIAPRWVVLAVAAVTLGWLAATLIAGRPDGLLRVMVLGGGETVVARTPSGERLVMGSGATATELITVLDGLAPPWQRSVLAVTATRADRDTIAALAAALGRYHVRYAASPPLPDGASSVAWQRAALEQGIAPLPISGDALMLPDGVTLDALATGATDEEPAYRLSYGEVTVIVAANAPAYVSVADAASAPLTGTLVSDGHRAWWER